jgi:hypothetical protein
MPQLCDEQVWPNTHWELAVQLEKHSFLAALHE